VNHRVARAGEEEYGLSGIKPSEKDPVTSECRADYLDYKLKGSTEHLKVLAILFGIFNLMLLIPDKLMLTDMSAFAQVLAVRIVFSFLLFALYFRLKKIGSFRTLSLIVSIFELLAIAVFIFVFLKYEEPNLLIQALGMLIIIIGVFVIPNQWVSMLVVSAIGSVGFLFCAYSFIGNFETVAYWASVVYIAAALVLCAYTAYKTGRFQFREFVARRELEHISSTDYLTKTANRYKLDEEAGKWIDFCQRNSLPLTLVFIDIDDFKAVNDMHGHNVGDSVLSSLTDLIRGQLRTSDVISRWGGDEFILLLPNTTLESAVAIVERIKTSITENVFLLGVKITCCYGIVEMKENSDLKSMIEEADCLMYAGKKREKNGLRYLHCD